jgi:hypothetical protein
MECSFDLQYQRLAKIMRHLQTVPRNRYLLPLSGVQVHITGSYGRVASANRVHLANFPLSTKNEKCMRYAQLPVRGNSNI